MGRAQKGKRVELHYPDPAANPYLAFAAMLMAGLDGIQNKIRPGDLIEKPLRIAARGTDRRAGRLRFIARGPRRIAQRNSSVTATPCEINGSYSANDPGPLEVGSANFDRLRKAACDAWIELERYRRSRSSGASGQFRKKPALSVDSDAARVEPPVARRWPTRLNVRRPIMQRRKENPGQRYDQRTESDDDAVDPSV
jgi:hypothetical protein